MTELVNIAQAKDTPPDASESDGADARGAVITILPGQRLKHAREKVGMSIDDIANQMNLSTTIVKALETDDYNALPNATYVVGYMRAYARQVNAPAEDIVRSFKQITASDEPEEEAPITTYNKSRWSLNDPAVRYSSYALLVFLCFTVMIWWTQMSEDTDTGDTTAAVERVDGSTVVADIDADPMVPDTQPIGMDYAIKRAEASATASVAAEAETETPAAVTTEAAVAEQPVVAAPVETTPVVVENTIDMTFDGECWVRVWDAQGNTIHAKSHAAGDTLQLQGEGPFEVLLGDVGQVSLAFNNEAVDLSRYASRTVARFRLE